MRYNTKLVRTEDSLEMLEEKLVHWHGDMSRAAGELGVSVASIHFWMEEDERSAARIRLAQSIGWSRLENAAYERAVVGVEEDVWFQGQVVGQKRVYSDSLLSQMLKARNHAYRAEESTGPKVMVNIMPRANSYEEWVQLRTETLKQIAAPVAQVEYTDYTPVTESALRDVL